MTDTDKTTSRFADERAASTGGTAAAAAREKPWNYEEAKADLTPFEQKLATFVNRRINAEPDVKVNVEGRATEVLEYVPGGIGLGKLKVSDAGLETDHRFVDCDETMLEMLLVKIIHD